MTAIYLDVGFKVQALLESIRFSHPRASHNSIEARFKLSRSSAGISHDTGKGPRRTQTSMKVSHPGVSVLYVRGLEVINSSKNQIGNSAQRFKADHILTSCGSVAEVRGNPVTSKLNIHLLVLGFLQNQNHGQVYSFYGFRDLMPRKKHE